MPSLTALEQPSEVLFATRVLPDHQPEDVRDSQHRSEPLGDTSLLQARKRPRVEPFAEKVNFGCTTSFDLSNSSDSNNWPFSSPCSFRVKVLTGDFVEKRGLQNTNPSRRVPPNALQNASPWNPKWLPTTKYKTKIIKNHQVRAAYKIDSRKSCPIQGS